VNGSEAHAESAPRPVARRIPRAGAEYVELRVAEVSFILGDMIEHLGLVIQHWNLAAGSVRSHPDVAAGHMVDAEIDLDIAVRIGLAEVLRATRAASARLYRELPDDDEEQPLVEPAAES
jgi:hypothetical protein